MPHAQPASPAIDGTQSIASGLVACWPFHEGTGNPIDLVSGYVITLSTGHTWNAAGTYGKQVDAAGAAVAMTNFGASGSEGYSMAALVKQTSGDLCGTPFRYRIEARTAGWQFRPLSGSGIGTADCTRANFNVLAGGMTSGGQPYLYANGVMGPLGSSGGSSSTGDLRVLGRVDFMVGSLAGFYVWNRELTPTEHAALAADFYYFLKPSGGGSVQQSRRRRSALGGFGL